LSKQTILVVDDEQDLLDLIEYNLKNEGYQVLKAENGLEGIKIARESSPDLILLDIMMPKMDGLQVCEEIRRDQRIQHIPIIFLTARGDERTEVEGLDRGADDYITKPISTRKLMSRLKAVLRRSHDEEELEPRLTAHGIEIDRERYLVIKDGDELHLPRKEFELLYALAHDQGKVLTREKLLNRVWGDHVYVVDRTIDVHIRKIREKIGDDLIETVKGVGYRFKA
jgi:two-component system, OmpR family, alkaline phosphatase synthesis response regulator PhoP